MNLSELQSKDIITTDGKVIGNIIDVVIDNGKVSYLVVEKNKLLRFSTSDEIKVRWEQIKKIGEDVILVSID